MVSIHPQHQHTSGMRDERLAKWIEELDALMLQISASIKRNDVVAFVRHHQRYEYLLKKIRKATKPKSS